MYNLTCKALQVLEFPCPFLCLPSWSSSCLDEWILEAVSISLVSRITWVLQVSEWQLFESMTGRHGLFESVTGRHGLFESMTGRHGLFESVTGRHGLSKFLTVRHGLFKLVVDRHGLFIFLTGGHELFKILTDGHGLFKPVTSGHGLEHVHPLCQIQTLTQVELDTRGLEYHEE